MLFWLYDLPLPLMAVLICLPCLAFTWGGLLALRPCVRRWLGPQPGANDLVSTFLSAYGVFYGLMLGLIAVATYQNFSDVETAVQREAAAVAGLYRDVSAHPQPAREQLQSALREYTRFVIEDVWPAQQRGEQHPGDTRLVTELHAALTAFEPGSRREELLHAEALREFDQFLEARYLRLEVSSASLSPVLWWVVVIGAALNLALLWLFSVDRLALHLLLSGTLALFVGLMLFFIAAMDYPFRGEESISPDAFALVRDRLMGSTR
ncbi:MAG: DUF4239 domain-containing protein [Comamonadaceae bacterium]|nr:MAG: DUF4239 domain-containing protein [Comamonadaceae bacterium]